ncbi:hypothetical protein LTR56_021366 [Elasticomyces elasticus]|nr:hypothetical protein LTR22_026146 [Elasticomyces elasticus]KAK3623812.1 hypothetical protein LTR56_021366 [Elasticomyces elasticus]KAK4921020.1 hypothetical protein LTR49_011564 [Elasticomyces elasticus]KAK5759475.1 hypothetical protein LTS12_010333 [Elasticomyces elasticus]
MSNREEGTLTIAEEYRMIAELSGDTLANFSVDNEPQDAMKHNRVAIVSEELLARVNDPHYFRDLMHNAALNLESGEDTEEEAQIIFDGWEDASSRMPYAQARFITSTIHSTLHRYATQHPRHRALCIALLVHVHGANEEAEETLEGDAPAYGEWALGHDRTGQ